MEADKRLAIWSKSTAACSSGMQEAQYYVGNPLLNLYVVQVLVISITQKKVKITKQECNPFSPYQAHRKPRT